MNLLINVIDGLVSVLHIYFLVLEMFLWTTPKGLKIFGQKLEQAKASEKLAANQGLYNGFLAAGLIWGLLASVPEQAQDIQIFFLSCVVIAGLYGAYSVSRKILYIQALPALLGLVLILL
ncbi:MAG: DUF1304 domain-containing protein [Pseudobdellovibrionaceae bacterium]